MGVDASAIRPYKAASMRIPVLVLTLSAASAFAATVSKPVSYDLGKTKFEGVLVFDDASKTPRPGLVLVPNWMGITEANVAQAKRLAADRYVILVADMYGKDVRPKNVDDAGKASGAVKSDRKLMRARVNKALEVLRAQSKSAPLELSKLGAIGFCFGGTTALELARSGAKIGGVVSFHGGLETPSPADAKNITARVLALHGADDPFVPKAEVDGFVAEMRATKVDWQLTAYGNTVHSFTDLEANLPGQAEYNESSAKRAYAEMERFFSEIFGS
jgi:dienelactone hydrolase